MHAKRRCFFERTRGRQGARRSVGRSRGGDRLLVPEGWPLHRRQLAAGGRGRSGYVGRVVAGREARHHSLAARRRRPLRDRPRFLPLLQDPDAPEQGPEVSGNGSKAAPFAIASAAACALGIAAAFLLPASVRGAAVYGAVAASLGAVCAFTALVRATGKGVNDLLLGFSIGFLCRAALVGIGLVASGARDNLAL